MCLCIGPSGSGKTLLLRKLQNVNLVDETSTAVPTVGTNLFTLYSGNNRIEIREVGGAMAPLWHKYYKSVSKVIYVVDTSNLCQISAAGVLLYAALAHPLLRNARVRMCTRNTTICCARTFWVFPRFFCNTNASLRRKSSGIHRFPTTGFASRYTFTSQSSTELNLPSTFVGTWILSNLDCTHIVDFTIPLC